MKLSRLTIFSVLILDIISIGIMIPAFDALESLFSLKTITIQLPWLPWLTELVLTPGTLISFGISLYALCAFFSAPFLGRLSDRYGRKIPLLVSVVGTCLSYVVLIVTHNYWMYLASRVINGLTGGNISIIQAILADLSPTSEERNKNFGLLGAIFGVGFIIGPLIGTVLMKVSNVEAIFIFGAVLSALEVASIWLFYRETHPADTSVRLSLNIVGPFIRYFSMPQIAPYLWSFLLFNTGIFLFQAVMTLAMKQYFDIPGENIGYFLAVQGALIAINQSVLYPRFWTKQFTPWSLILGVHAVSIVFFCAMGVIGNFPIFAILWLLISPVGSLFSAIYTTQIIEKTDRNEAGGVNGILASIGSVTMILGPLIGGFLLSTSIRTFWGTAFFIALSLILMFMVNMRLQKKTS